MSTKILQLLSETFFLSAKLGRLGHTAQSMLEIYCQDALALISAGILSCQLLQKILQNEKTLYKNIFKILQWLREAAKKSYFLNGSTIRGGGGGGKVFAIKKAKPFWELFPKFRVFLVQKLGEKKKCKNPIPAI